MPNLQAIKTKTKQAFHTEEVQNQILENLTLEQVLEFIQELSKKTLEKKKAQDLKVQNSTLPPHIRQEVGESLAEIKNGNFVDTMPDEEVSIVNSIQKMKKLDYVHTA